MHYNETKKRKGRAGPEIKRLEMRRNMSDMENKEFDENDYEDVCFICRRPESKAGKMFHLPQNISVCNDCMHKTMDTVSQMDYNGMLNDPALVQEWENMTHMSDRGKTHMDAKDDEDEDTGEEENKKNKKRPYMGGFPGDFPILVSSIFQIFRGMEPYPTDRG